MGEGKVRRRRFRFRFFFLREKPWMDETCREMLAIFGVWMFERVVSYAKNWLDAMFIDFLHLGEGNTCPTRIKHHGFPEKKHGVLHHQIAAPLLWRGLHWWYHQRCKNTFSDAFLGRSPFFGISKDLNFKPLKFNMEPDLVGGFNPSEKY